MLVRSGCRGNKAFERVKGNTCRQIAVPTGDAPIKVQQDRKKLMEGHFNISITKRVSLENSTDLGRGAAPELKSVEFLSETPLLVVEQIKGSAGVQRSFFLETQQISLSLSLGDQTFRWFMLSVSIYHVS